MYGNRLTREYGDSVPDAWARAINQLRDYELKRGLERLLYQGNASAPTLPQFVKACRDGNESGGAVPNHSPQQQLQLTKTRVACHANRCLMSYLLNFPVTDASLPKLIATKNRIVTDYESMDVDGELTDADGAVIRDALFKAWKNDLSAKPPQSIAA